MKTFSHTTFDQLLSRFCFNFKKVDIDYLYQCSGEDFPEEELSVKHLKTIDAKKQEEIEAIRKQRVIPALPTLYTVNNQIDFEVMESMMNRLAAQGIRTFLVEGTTGEASLHSHEEQVQAFQEAHKIRWKLEQRYPGEKFYLISGTGSNNTREQNHLTKKAFEHKADGVLLLPPYYLKTSPQGLLEHLWEGLNHGPSIIYSISGRTGMEISIKVLSELALHPNFIGVKECDGLAKCEALKNANIPYWTGNDDELIQSVEDQGAQGGISVVANLRPDIVGGIVGDIIDGKGADQATHRVQSMLSQLAFPPGHPNPQAIHTFEAMRQWTDRIIGFDVFRSPVYPLTKEQQIFFQEILKKGFGIRSEILNWVKVVMN